VPEHRRDIGQSGGETSKAKRFPQLSAEYLPENDQEVSM
jgi:hypothetical protein